jgi:hypothetical protein
MVDGMIDAATVIDAQVILRNAKTKSTLKLVLQILVEKNMVSVRGWFDRSAFSSWTIKPLILRHKNLKKKNIQR